nr:hypothetical protein [Chelatococcus sp. YT9]
MTRNYFKIYACSRWNHAPIEAARDMRVTYDLKPSDIASVTVHTYDPATRLGGNTVANAYAAKHSIAFNVAVQLMHGSNDAGVYTDAIVHDPAMVALIEKVGVKEDPALTALLPGVRAARVEITLKSGETYSARSDVPIGGFDNPLPEAELRAKFRRLAGLALPEEAIDSLERMVASLETAERIEAI